MQRSTVVPGIRPVTLVNMAVVESLSVRSTAAAVTWLVDVVVLRDERRPRRGDDQQRDEDEGQRERGQLDGERCSASARARCARARRCVRSSGGSCTLYRRARRA